MDQEFDILAAKVLAGEASAWERARLDALIANAPELEREWAELEVASQSLSDLGPLLGALDAPRGVMPVEHRHQLEQAFRAQFGPPQAPASKRTAISSGVQDAFAWGNGLNWLIGRRWVMPTAATLLLLCGTGLWLSKSASKPAASEQDTRTAFVLLHEGHGARRHGHRSQPLQAVTPLRPEDELWLAAGARASAITPQGSVVLVGPRKIGPGGFASLVTAEPSAPGLRQQEGYRIAMFEPAASLDRNRLLDVVRGAQGIQLYSPLGATESLTPVFLWEQETGKTYELIITDELDSKRPPWQLSTVTPPVKFSQFNNHPAPRLDPNGLYRARISRSDAPLTASTYTFRTLEQARVTPARSGVDALIYAAQLLGGDSERRGDALAELLGLPEPLASSELALRLKLLAFGQSGYREEFELLADRLQHVQ